MKRLVRASSLAIVATLFACSGGAPVLSDISLSRSRVSRGQEFFAVIQATDPSGSFDRGRVEIEIERNMDLANNDEKVNIESDVAVVGVPEDASESSIIVGLNLFGDMPLGVYDLSLRLIDNDGDKSDSVTTPITVTQ